MFRSSSPTYSEPDYTMPELTTARTSPLHFLYPHLPPLSSTQSAYSYSSYPASSTPNAKSHSKAAKQKRRRTPDHDDISRLLDPSYLPSSSSRSGVYVDPSGEVHDPDYRHFPLVAAPSHGPHYSSAHNHGHHQHHHHHSHGTNNHHSAKRHAGTRGRTSPRPHFDWELEVDECALDDEYPPEEEENHHRYGYSRGGQHAGGLGSASSGRSFSSANSSPVIMRRPRDSSFSTANTSPTWYPSPAMTDSTLPTSYEREGTLDDDKEKEVVVGKKEEKKKRCKGLSKGEKEKEKIAADEEKRLASAARTSFDHPLPSTVEEEDSASHSTTSRAAREEDEDKDEDETIMARHQEYVPTCSQSLRRSWQAFALRFRFGVFRAQRRMMRRVHSIM